MTIGIYAIRNKINQKMYIGKSKNIEKRFWSHRNTLSKKERNKKQTNRFLWSSVQKYGLENFEFLILESIDFHDEDYLADLEIFYMDFYNSCDRNFGYNLRRDSSTKTEIHDETKMLHSESNKGESNPNYGNRWTPEMKLKMSELKKDWHKTHKISDELRCATAQRIRKMWEDPVKKNQMAKAVSKSKSNLRFYQYDKVSFELIKIWESIDEIKNENPDYHLIAIYSVCNGHKKSYRGFIWKSELKEKNG